MTAEWSSCSTRNSRQQEAGSDREVDMVQADLSAFFMAYSERMNDALAPEPKVDVEGMAAAFTDTFIAAGPQGVSCSSNDEKYREMIGKGLEFYRSIGTKSMRVLAIEGGEI